MMDISNTTILSLLLIANASLVAAGSIAIMRFCRQARRFEKFWESPTGLSLADTQTVHSDPLLEKRVAELQSVVRTLAQKPKAGRDTFEASLPIENAVRMARSGASIDELIRSCGLNIGEAQLMRKLHGKSRVVEQATRASA
jgi:hypothetical protein